MRPLLLALLYTSSLFAAPPLTPDQQAIADHITEDDLRNAHHAASTLLGERFRSYLPGRLLPHLLSRFCDDVAEGIGLELPEPARRSPVRPAKIEELTSSELNALSGAVLALVTQFESLMDDPALPGLLRAFRDELAAEKAERARIASELR